MAEAKLSSKHQVVVPREAREALGLKPGDRVLMTVHRGRLLILEKPKSYRAALRGFLDPGPREYLRKERASWD